MKTRFLHSGLMFVNCRQVASARRHVNRRTAIGRRLGHSLVTFSFAVNIILGRVQNLRTHGALLANAKCVNKNTTIIILLRSRVSYSRMGSTARIGATFKRIPAEYTRTCRDRHGAVIFGVEKK